MSSPEKFHSPTMKKDEVKHKFRALHLKAKQFGLTGDDFRKLDALREIAKTSQKPNAIGIYLWKSFVGVFCVCLTVFLIWCLEWPVKNDQMISMYFRMFSFTNEEMLHEPCAVEVHDTMLDVFRPPIPCGFCKGVDKVEKVSKLSPEQFEKRFAYTGKPVVIMDGMANWTATNSFSFNFFKNIYKEGSSSLENVERKCQFFPYKTSFKSLGDVFKMEEERANLSDGSKPWYIGWSNCDSAAGSILRQHYTRPYFLPPVAESSKTDWIFMGSPGYGAHMHIDNVKYPSWQAQVTGTKRWTLEPPPECYMECGSRMDVIIQPGEIIVLDTNRWFHSTLNVGDDMSITIGSEYD